MLNKQKPFSWDWELFFKEEFKGEKIVNYVRAFVAVALAFLAYAKAGVFIHLVFSEDLIFTTYILIFAAFYTAILFIIFKLNFYHPFIKYVSTSIDLTLVILSIYVYKLDTLPEYATIHFLARYGLLFIFMSLTLLRYSFSLGVYSGILVGLEYLFLIVHSNYMTNLKFSFIGPNGQTFFSSFHITEGYLKVIYLVIGGIVFGVIALNLKKLVINSITKEQEKTSLMMENKIFDTINNENKKYLDNIKEGLLLINRHFLIKGHYSKFLENIFEKKGFEGSNFIDLIYPENKENEEKRRLLNKFLNLMFKDTLADDDMLKEVNPIVNEKIKITKPDGETVEKIITALFFKIIDNKVIQEIMVIFEDRTDIAKAEKELGEERIKRETELEYIAVILKAPEQNLLDFVEDTIRVLDYFELNIDNLDNKFILNEVFREIHSLKGLSRSMEFKSISQAIHDIENVLGILRDKNVNLTYEVKNDLRKKVNVIFYEIDNIKILQEKFKRFSNINISVSQKRDTRSLDDFIENLKKMTEDISKELLKKVNFSSENKLKDEVPFLRYIKNPIIHLLRNALDHGIEDRFERISNGKDEFGNIKLKFNKDGSNYVIEIADDGEGINFNRIKKTALEKGLIKENEEAPNNKLLNLLFKPGFSTSKKVTNFSGRGVGLDVVKNTINKLNGKISVLTEKNKGTKFIIKIPE